MCSLMSSMLEAVCNGNITLIQCKASWPTILYGGSSRKKRKSPYLEESGWVVFSSLLNIKQAKLADVWWLGPCLYYWRSLALFWTLFLAMSGFLMEVCGLCWGCYTWWSLESADLIKRTLDNPFNNHIQEPDSHVESARWQFVALLSTHSFIQQNFC